MEKIQAFSCDLLYSIVFNLDINLDLELDKKT